MRIIFIALTLVLASCTSISSKVYTLGHGGDTNLKLLSINGTYDRPIVRLDDGLFIWVAPDKTYSAEAYSTCFGVYDGFSINLWSSMSINLDLNQSSVINSYGEKGKIQYIKKWDGNFKYEDKNIINLSMADIDTIDDVRNRMKEMRSPSYNLVKKADRFQIKIYPGIDCSNGYFSMRFVFSDSNGEKRNYSLNFFPVLHTLFSH